MQMADSRGLANTFKSTSSKGNWTRFSSYSIVGRRHSQCGNFESPGSSPEEKSAATQRERGSGDGLEAVTFHRSINGVCTRPNTRAVVVAKSRVLSNLVSRGQENGQQLNPKRQQNTGHTWNTAMKRTNGWTHLRPLCYVARLVLSGVHCPCAVLVFA